MATGVKSVPLCLTMGFYVEVPLATDASDGLPSAALIKVQTSHISLRKLGYGPEVSFRSRNEAMIAVYTPPPLKEQAAIMLPAQDLSQCYVPGCTIGYISATTRLSEIIFGTLLALDQC